MSERGPGRRFIEDVLCLNLDNGNTFMVLPSGFIQCDPFIPENPQIGDINPDFSSINPDIPGVLDALPAKVQSTVETLKDSGIDYVLTTNPNAQSCSDAAEKRYRPAGVVSEAGHVGVEPPDELKTLLYQLAKPIAGGIGYAAVHLQGSDAVDNKALKNALGTKSSQVKPELLAEVFDAEYGAVNPVLLAKVALERGIGLIQMYDEAVLSDERAPMTTNAGDHLFCIHTKTADLYENLPGNKEKVAVAKHPLPSIGEEQ